MSLKKFTLPGKDSRCIRYDGQVYKIKTLMPPPNNGDIREYIDDQPLQEELEDIIRAVLAVPSSVDPVMMKTSHFVVKPERKEWKLALKVDFKENGQLLRAHSFMYTLNVKLLEEENSPGVQTQAHMEETSKRTAEVDISTYKKRGRSGTHASSSPLDEQGKRPKRQLYQEETRAPASNPVSAKHSNRRRAPSRSCTTTQPRYKLRNRTLKLSSARRGGSQTTPRFSPDVVDLEDRIDEEVWGKQDSETDIMKREGIERDIQKERSPELESGFSRLVQGRAPVGPERFIQVDEAGGPNRGQTSVPSTGDQGPLPAKPSGDGRARFGVLPHPGRERVEQHVLLEQLRLQEMAGPVGDASPKGHQEANGVVHRLIDAIVTPVKNFFK